MVLWRVFQQESHGIWRSSARPGAGSRTMARGIVVANGVVGFKSLLNSTANMTGVYYILNLIVPNCGPM